MAVQIIENPALQLAVISIVAVIVQNLLFKKLSDQAQLKEVKKQVETAQKRMKEAQKAKDTSRMEKELSKINELSMRRMKLTLKPNLLSSLAFILIFGFVQTTYKDLLVKLPIPLLITKWAMPPFAIVSELTWFWWYFYIAIVASIIVRQVLEIDV